MLDAASHQGKFGEDYVRALASAAGLLVYTYDLDRDGVDLGLRAPGRYTRYASPSVEFQIKTSSRWSTPGTALSYRGLTEAQFNRLVGPTQVPRYLVIILVPPDREEYAVIGAAGMVLRYIGYYVSLRDLPAIAEPDKRRRVRIDVPTANVLTVDTVRALARNELVV